MIYHLSPDWRIVTEVGPVGRTAFEYRSVDALGEVAWVPVEHAPMSRKVRVPEAFLGALSQYLKEIPSDAAEVALDAGAGQAADTLLEGSWLTRAGEQEKRDPAEMEDDDDGTRDVLQSVGRD